MNIELSGLAMAFAQSSSGDVPDSGGFSGVLSGTPWIDIVGLGIIIFFFIRGISTGLVWQVARLIGVVIAVMVARSLSPDFTPRVQEALSLPLQACQGLVWFMVFGVTLVVAALMGRLGQRTLEAVQLGPMDRLGGALAGTLTGAIVHCALLVLLSAVGTTAWTAHMLDGSKSASMLDSLSRKQHLLLDAEAAERVVGPWGHEYDQAQQKKRERQMEQQRKESLRHAEQLRKQADEEVRRANRQNASAPANRRGGGIR